jgi:transketolase
MAVVMPADAYETEHAVRAAAAADGPFFISLAHGEPPNSPPEEERTFRLGDAVLLRDGDAATVFAVGPMVPEALRAAEILSARGVAVRVLNMHTIKPIDRQAILRAAQDTPRIITLEEHTVVGGLGGAVAEVLADAGARTPLTRLGLQDTFAVMCGSREDFWRRFGLSAEAVAEAVVA